MLNPTPWASDDSTADHTAEVLRMVAYLASGDADGVVGPGDCKVRALSTPGNSVRIAPGAWAGRNRATGARSQSFVAQVATETTVPIAATGSGGGRRDLICVVITNGSTHEVRVIPNVGASVKRLQEVPGEEYTTGYALAAVTLPASTSTVTAAMVADLRQLLKPESRRVTVVGKPIAGQGPTAAWGTWPSLTGQVLVPAWATHATVIASFESFKVNAGISQGSMRAKLGTLVGAHRQYDFPSASGSIQSLQTVAADSVASMAGTVQTVSLETIAGAAGNLITLAASQQVFDIQFEQRVS